MISLKNLAVMGCIFCQAEASLTSPAEVYSVFQPGIHVTARLPKSPPHMNRYRLSIRYHAFFVPSITLVKTAGLKLRIVGDNVNIEVPIAADLTFSVPRDDSAAKDDADLRLSTKKGLFRWRPDIHTAGIPLGTRRLGDLRLECEVRWAVDKFDASLIKLAYLVPLGGVCHTSRSRVFYSTNAPITGATLVSGSRRERLPVERLDAKDRARYAPPLHDQSWPDDTLVEFESAMPTNATAADTVSLP